MAQHPIFAEDMQEIVESFVVETREIIERLDNDLLKLEQTPEDGPLVDEIFRSVHTVKGTSGFLSLHQLNRLTHHFEEVLNLLRRKELVVRPGTTDVMFEAFDLMKVLVDQVIDQDIREMDLDPILERLSGMVRGEVPEKRPSPSADPAGKAPARESSTPSSRGSSTDTIRVEVERLDHLLNLVGELVLGRNRLAQLAIDVATIDGERLQRELDDTNAQIDSITTELQAAIMHTRMVPIGRVFSKLPRMVRDLAKEFGKQIDIRIEGEDTELDKSLVEEIGDPLVHLIRNAADHGIERPDERRKSGKPETGTVRLSASHEGNHIAVRITDDGGGMDPELLKRRAIERSIITEREAVEMGPAEALQLIFRPGFSTASEVSTVSGRGVGMDVVKTNITRMNGTVSIESEVGVGTTFILKLPLTLAIIQSLLVRVGGETFAIPLHSVIEVVKLGKHQVTTINGRKVIRLRDQVLPIVRTASVLSVPEDIPRPLEQQNAVIVAVAHHQLGLSVDKLIGQKEIVVKPLGSYLRKVPGIAGSTILGDGRVIMIVDVGELVRMHVEQNNVRAGVSGHTA